MPVKIVREQIPDIEVDAVVKLEEMSVETSYGIVNGCRPPFEDERKYNEYYSVSCLPLGCAYFRPVARRQFKSVIHVTVPILEEYREFSGYAPGGIDDYINCLCECYRSALTEAEKKGCRSIAIPLIGANEQDPSINILRLAFLVIGQYLEKSENEMHVYLDVPYEYSAFVGKKTYRNATRLMRVERAAEERRRSSNVGMSMSLMALPREYLDDRDESFRERLFRMIDERGLTDVECYKRANVDKRTFSKIKSRAEYKPSKQTAVAFAIALRLNLKETLSLLETLGYTLSKTLKFDRIIRYFIHKENYDIFEINQVLFELDEVLLGNFN